ncbi:hypothetical protein SISNIDRAFT_471570 [Sistotremastrum niveocremeum HHB9708]|uniref:Uncharacterized protein n=1 Tax=Sistotremastrum niveocremeum HHB9708 TaxID=1314777 RepID=A0A164MGL4_9AGAM|nr:hypothetical protein SISNIDRAFT_471570 [Sistotremastrum niveocremeum HHB9708]
MGESVRRGALLILQRLDEDRVVDLDLRDVRLRLTGSTGVLRDHRERREHFWQIESKAAIDRSTPASNLDRRWRRIGKEPRVHQICAMCRLVNVDEGDMWEMAGENEQHYQVEIVSVNPAREMRDSYETIHEHVVDTTQIFSQTRMDGYESRRSRTQVTKMNSIRASTAIRTFMPRY